MQYNAVIKLAEAINQTDDLRSKIWDALQSIEGHNLGGQTNKYKPLRNDARELLTRNVDSVTSSLIGNDISFEELQAQAKSMTQEALDKYNDAQEGWVDRTLTNSWSDDLRIVPQEILEVLGLGEHDGDVCGYEIKDRSQAAILNTVRFVLGLIIKCDTREGMTLERIEDKLKGVIKRNRRTFKRSQFFVSICKEDGLYKPNLEALGIEQEVIDALSGDILCQKKEDGVRITIGNRSFGYPDTFVDAASRIQEDLPQLISSEIASRIHTMVERTGTIDYDLIAEQCHIKPDVAKVKADELCESMGLVQKRFVILDYTTKHSWTAHDFRVQKEGQDIPEDVTIVGEGLTYNEAMDIRQTLEQLINTGNRRSSIGKQVAELEEQLGKLRGELVETTIINQELQQQRAEIKEKFNLNI